MYNIEDGESNVSPVRANWVGIPANFRRKLRAKLDITADPLLNRARQHSGAPQSMSPHELKPIVVRPGLIGLQHTVVLWLTNVYCTTLGSMYCYLAP